MVTRMNNEKTEDWIVRLLNLGMTLFKLISEHGAWLNRSTQDV